MMTRANRFGLTWIERSVIVAIIVILIALLLAPVQGVADGDFDLHLSFTGSTPPTDRFRVAVGYGHDAEKSLNGDLMTYLNWHEPDAWERPMPPIRCPYSYKLKTDWRGRFIVPKEFPRLLIAEYQSPNEAPRYRAIPFVRKSFQETVELTVPREPPSEAEAWKSESTGRGRVR
jgi:hypothetical protein